MRELQSTLERYRGLSSQATASAPAAILPAASPLRERAFDVYSELVEEYVHLLDAYVQRISNQREKPRLAMESLSTRLGNAAGGPRDLLDIHLAALYKVAGGRTDERSRAYVLEGRLLALEMMGQLVDFYRMGGGHSGGNYAQS